MNENIIWKEILGYEGLYKINEFGEIYSYYTNKILKPEVLKKGNYLRIGLYKNGEYKRFLIHRLVAIHFLDQPNSINLEIHHKDYNTQNNHFTNLEWINGLENLKRSYDENPDKREEYQKRMSEIGKKYNHIGVEASKKPVARCDKITKEILETYESAREAAKQGYNYKNISQVCHGNKKSHMGYYWKFI